MIKSSYLFVISTLLLGRSMGAMEPESATYKTIRGELIHLASNQLFSIIELYDSQQYKLNSFINSIPYYWQDDPDLKTKEKFLNKIISYNNITYITLAELMRLKKYQNFHDSKAQEIFNNSYRFSVDIGILHIRYANALNALARSFRMNRRIIIDATNYTKKQCEIALQDPILIEEYWKNTPHETQQALEVMPSAPINNRECLIS